MQKAILVDKAILAVNKLKDYLAQGMDEQVSYDESLSSLTKLISTLVGNDQ